MENEKLITYAPELPSSNDSMAVSFVKMVKLNMIEAQKSFFEIGFRLYEAQQNEYYKDLGFESLVECAEFHFGFKKTMVYDLINVFIAFSDMHKSNHILPAYKDFSQSQLIEMSKVKPPTTIFYLMCKPTDTVAKIREARSIYNKENMAYEFYSCKSLDELIQAYNKKYAVKQPKIVVEEAIVNGEPVLDEENEIEKEPIEVEYQSKGIELKADVPKEEKAEITEDLLPYEDFIKSFFSELSSTLTTMFYLNANNLSDDKVKELVRRIFVVYHNLFNISKKDFKDQLCSYYEKFDYEITLNGRNQPLKVFISNIVNSFIDILEPPKENKK